LINKKNIIIGLGIIWLIYSLIAQNFGVCPFWIEEYDDGWYVMDVITEDDIDYPEQYDGPFDEKTATDYIIGCREEASRFKKNYGTIYNLIPENRDVYGKRENLFMSILSIIMDYTFMLLPLYFLYKIYQKNDLKNNET